MNPESKAIIIKAMREIADAWEADGDSPYPDFENDVTVIVDNPSTAWPEDRLVTTWSLSAYDKSYKKLREISAKIADERNLQYTTSFIPDDTIEVTFIIQTLNQGSKKKNAG
jgi:hypothetical protein